MRCRTAESLSVDELKWTKRSSTPSRDVRLKGVGGRGD